MEEAQLTQFNPKPLIMSVSPTLTREVRIGKLATWIPAVGPAIGAYNASRIQRRYQIVGTHTLQALKECRNHVIVSSTLSAVTAIALSILGSIGIVTLPITLPWAFAIAGSLTLYAGITIGISQLYVVKQRSKIHAAPLTAVLPQENRPIPPFEWEAPDPEIRARYSQLLNRYDHLMDEETLGVLKQHQTFLETFPEKLTQEHISAYEHIGRVVAEIDRGDYPEETIKTVLKILLKMTSFGVRQETLTSFMNLSALKNTKTAYREPHRNMQGGAIQVIKASEESESLAKIKSSTSWYGKLGCELLAYELEHVLGHDGVPTVIQRGRGSLLQEYVPHSCQMSEQLEKENGHEVLQDLDETQMHAFLTLALVRGRGDGHGGNTILQQPKQGGKARLWDIDEEEDFIKENLGSEKLHHLQEGNHNPHLVALGLPQAGKPLSRLLCTLFSWDGIVTKGLRQFEFRGQKLPSSAKRKQALKERLEKVVEACWLESHNENPTLTPRELYFLIHGKDITYYRFKKGGITDLELFSGLIKCEDHNAIPKSGKEKKASFDALDTPFETNPFLKKPEMPRYWSPWEARFELSRNLSATEKWVIDPLLFDAKKWDDYKEACREAGRPPKSSMLSYCLQGWPRRIVRHMAHHLPLCTFDVVQGEDQQLHLQITKTQSLLEIEEKVSQLKGDESCILLELSKDEFHLEKWKSHVKEGYRSQSTDNKKIFEYIQEGPKKEIFAWIYHFKIDRITLDAHLTLKETEDSVEIHYHVHDTKEEESE